MPSFRTYEAQSRLLAAVLATNPTLKLNYQAIALHYGSDTTTAGAEHRFRPLKQLASLLRKAVAEKEDAKELASLFRLSDKEIAKYYGESTKMGIEFQFRGIKKVAKAMRDGTDEGAASLPARATAAPASGTAQSRKRKAPVTPANAASAGSSSSASASASASATASAPASASAPPPPAAKRARRPAEPTFSNEEDASTFMSEEIDYEQLDLTPVSTPAHRMGSTATASAPLPAVVPSSLAPITPSTGASAQASYLTDTTPALSTGVSPPDQASPDQDLAFHTAAQHQRQPAFYQQNNHAANANVANSVVIDDDDDVPAHLEGEDDDVFIIDTPTKMPKVPKMEAPPASTATMQNIADFSGWDARSQSQSQGLNQNQGFNFSQPTSQGQQFSFETSGSSWAQVDFFSGGGNDVTFGEPGSFYDNDGAI